MNFKKHEDFLENVIETLKERENHYGDANCFLKSVSNRWSSYLDSKIESENVICMMLEIKKERLKNIILHKENYNDTLIDIIGYCLILKEILDKKHEIKKEVDFYSESIEKALSMKDGDILKVTTKCLNWMNDYIEIYFKKIGSNIYIFEDETIFLLETSGINCEKNNTIKKIINSHEKIYSEIIFDTINKQIFICSKPTKEDLYKKFESLFIFLKKISVEYNYFPQ